MEKKLLIDNYHSWENYPYESYVEWCEGNDTEPQEEDSNDYWEFVGREESFDFECLWDNLKYCESNDKRCVITGTLGLWDGHHDIYENFAESLVEAIQKCIEDCAYVRVEYDKECIYVSATHHDGTNCFEIRILSDKGNDTYYEEEYVDMEDKENFEELPEWLF